MSEVHFNSHAVDDSLIVQFDYIKRLLEHDLFEEAKGLLLELHPADLSDFFEQLPFEIQKIVINLIGNQSLCETLHWLSERGLVAVSEVVGITKLAELINDLDIDDAIEVAQLLEDDVRSAVINELSEDKRRFIIEGFTYSEHSAGRVMQKSFVALYENSFVRDAVNNLRNPTISLENFHSAIVVDKKQRPVGTISVATLLSSDDKSLISDVMNVDFKIAATHSELRELSYVFKQYELTIVPVVNRYNKLVGSISVNNMLYIVEEQVEEKILRLGGVNEDDMYENFIATARQRFPWLFINLIAAILTSSIIATFEHIIEQFVALVAVMPIVSSMGGNAGTQTMTVTVRAIASNDISKVNTSKVVLKELLSCGVNGLLLSILGGGIVFAFYRDIHLSYVFAMSVIVNFLVAGFFGASIPLTLHAIKIDPASASAVILTALTDSCGFFTVLTLAKIFLI